MRKVRIVPLVLLLAMLLLVLTSCGNKDVWDTVRTFNEAVLTLPDGSVVTGKVQSWRDYEDGDQLQVKVDGVTYLVHSSDCVLIAK